MKKVLVVLLVVVMAFTLSVAVMAEAPDPGIEPFGVIECPNSPNGKHNWVPMTIHKMICSYCGATLAV